MHDSHAEVIARRALVRYLLAHARLALIDDGPLHPSSIFDTAPSSRNEGESETSGKRLLRLKAGIKLHFFVSQMPCGDACVVSEGGSGTGAKEVTRGPDQGAIISAPSQSDVDAGRQLTGRARRKPGRGEPTSSMSCSDKIAKWVLLGPQGALLSHLLEGPVPIHSITILGEAAAAGSAAREEARKAAKRALVDRTAMVAESIGRNGGLCNVAPAVDVVAREAIAEILGSQAQRMLEGLAADERRKSKSGVSINWSALHYYSDSARGSGTFGEVHEVTLSASGRKAGASKRLRTGEVFNPKVVPTISRYAVLQSFRDLVASLLPPEEGESEGVFDKEWKSYGDLKRGLGTDYYRNWERMRTLERSIFSYWITKADTEVVSVSAVSAGLV